MNINFLIRKLQFNYKPVKKSLPEQGWSMCLVLHRWLVASWHSGSNPGNWVSDMDIWLDKISLDTAWCTKSQTKEVTTGCSNFRYMTIISYLRHHFFFLNQTPICKLLVVFFSYCCALDKRQAVFIQFTSKTCLQWLQNTYQVGVFQAPPAIHRKEHCEAWIMVVLFAQFFGSPVCQALLHKGLTSPGWKILD